MKAASPKLIYKMRGLTLPAHLTEDFTDKYQIEAMLGSKVVGTAIFLESKDLVWPDLVVVDPDYRRQGIATSLYVYAERQSGKKILRPDEHSEDASKLWNQPDRPFGVKASKQT
jgi:GNAT superfamily N-acetyltransferase